MEIKLTKIEAMCVMDKGKQHSQSVIPQLDRYETGRLLIVEV